MDFILSFVGSFLGCLCFHYYNPKPVYAPKVEPKPSPNAPQSTINKKTNHIPKGTVIKSDTPEDERKRKSQEFERLAYKRREEVTNDYRT